MYHPPYVRCPSCGSTFKVLTPAPAAGAVLQPWPPAAQASENRAGMMPMSVLHSWKDIASYTGRGVRTVQRWERDFGFPVHRIKQRERSAVLAFAEEIKEWLHRTPVGLPKKSPGGGVEVAAKVRSGRLRNQCA